MGSIHKHAPPPADIISTREPKHHLPGSSGKHDAACLCKYVAKSLMEDIEKKKGQTRHELFSKHKV